MRKISFAVIFMLLGAFLAVGIAEIVNAQSGGVITACADNNNNGNLRLVSSSADCRQNEIAVQWNVVGPQGPMGPQGPAGPRGAAGADGATGPTGAPGANGLSCWDTNGNGTFDTASEDTNGDSLASAADCQGAQGEPGPAGPQGAQGEP